jgi:hypothetical protein
MHGNSRPLGTQPVVDPRAEEDPKVLYGARGAAWRESLRDLVNPSHNSPAEGASTCGVWSSARKSLSDPEEANLAPWAGPGVVGHGG